MTGSTRIGPRLGIGGGGIGLLGSLFLPWASAGGSDRNGFDFLVGTDVLFVAAAVTAIAAAVTGGRIGLFRHDLSLNGSADLLGVISSLVITWLLLFDLPAGASAGAGVLIGLVSAILIACAAGDYGVFRGEPAFPRRIESATRRNSAS